MDPWNSATCPASESGGAAKTMEGPDSCTNGFEDSFVNKDGWKTVVDVPHMGKIPAEKLPDSDKYLSKLYGKLSCLHQATSAKHLLNSIQDARDDHLVRLLNSSSTCDQGTDADDHPVTASYLQRRLLPQTVPLSSEELLQLLHADQLQRAHEEARQEDEERAPTDDSAEPASER